MSRICHAHCPSDTRTGWLILLIGIAAATAATLALQRIFTAIGKPALVITAGLAITATVLLVGGIIASTVRNATSTPTTKPRQALDLTLEHTTQVRTEPDSPAPGRRPHLQLVIDNTQGDPPRRSTPDTRRRTA